MGPNSLPQKFPISQLFFASRPQEKTNASFPMWFLRLQKRALYKFSNHLKPFLQNHRWLNTKSFLTGKCLTPTQLLICSSFSRKNGHLLLVCSSLSTSQLKKMSTRVIFWGVSVSVSTPFNHLCCPLKMEKHTIFKCIKNTNPVAPRDVRHIVVTQVNDARAHPTCIVGCDMVGFICVYNTLKIIHLTSFRANCYNSQIFIF